MTRNPSFQGLTILLEIFLPRLRERVLSGYTGTEAVTGTFVFPPSVDFPPRNDWKLTPAVPAKLTVRKLLLEAPANFVPAWYAVAFVEGLTDFRDLLVFFAPQPPLKDRAGWEAGYPDGYTNHIQQYVTRLDGQGLMRSAHKQLAFQVAQSGKKVVFVYPLLRFYTPQLGALLDGSKPLFDELIHYLQARFGGSGPSNSLPTVNRMAAASFSLGASNLAKFLNGSSGGVRSAIHEVYDFDSSFILDKKVPGDLVDAVRKLPGIVFRRYVQTDVPFPSRAWDQLLATSTYPLPAPRWAGLPLVQPDLSLHQDIANHMLTHALTRSSFS
jgi:hypothetical protein